MDINKIFPPMNVESKLTHMNYRMYENDNLRQPLRMMKIKWKRWILKSDNQLVNKYATHFWMRASGSEHMKRGYWREDIEEDVSPRNVERICIEDIKQAYIIQCFPDECMKMIIWDNL